MKIGIQTRPWGPEKNRRRLEEVLEDIASAGYDGLEIGAQHLDLNRPVAFRQLVQRHGLQVAAIHVGGEIYSAQAVETALPNWERAVVFAAQAGALFLALSGKAKEYKSTAELQVEAESLNRVGRLCREHGLRLAYHNHYWEIENHCSELRFLCDHTDANLVSLCLDVAWVYRADAAPAQVAEAFEERLAYLHLKDSTADEWMELGNGDVDLGALFPLVRRAGFPWLIVEQDETRKEPIESGRISRAYLKRYLQV